jgi:predicted XRE-type DNA-binding protein
MSNDDDFEIVRGSGNVFRDFGHPNADAEQLKALLAAQIITALDERKLTVRAAGTATGFAAADFSRIRQAKLDRFTIDRLMAILNKLDRRVDVTVNVAPKSRAGASPALAPAVR